MALAAKVYENVQKEQQTKAQDDQKDSSKKDDVQDAEYEEK